MQKRAHLDITRLQAFADAASQLCDLLEKPQRRNSWVAGVAASVASVYAMAHALPTTSDQDTADEFSKYDVGNEEWKRIYEQLLQTLGNQAFYWAYFDPSRPTDSPEEPVCGSLADDLADIYRDLKPGVRAWAESRDRYIANILLGWRDPSFGSHWGTHAVSAMRALHEIAYSRGLAAAEDE